MARKQQELKSVISVYGKADGSLDTLAKKIKSFGDNVSKIGGAMTMMTAPDYCGDQNKHIALHRLRRYSAQNSGGGKLQPKADANHRRRGQTGGRRHKVYGQRCGKRIFIADTGRRATGKQS